MGTENNLEKGALAFDFHQAVADARRDYPDETKHITFVNGSDKDATQQIAQWIERATPELQKTIPSYYADPILRAQFLLFSNQRSFAVKDPVSQKKLLVAPGVPSHSPLQVLSESKNLFFIFYHELAHLIIKEALPPGMKTIKRMEDKPAAYVRIQRKQEILCDIFSIARGFQMGYLNKEDALALADVRKKYDDGTHSTSTAIEALVANHAETDFAHLTPQVTKVKAIAQTRRFARAERKRL